MRRINRKRAAELLDRAGMALLLIFILAGYVAALSDVVAGSPLGPVV